MEILHFENIFGKTIGMVIGNSTGFVIAATYSFLLHHAWTFQVTTKKSKKMFAKFISIALVGLVLNNLWMVFFTKILDIHYIIASFLTAALVLIWNYLANRYWTFVTPSLSI